MPDKFGDKVRLRHVLDAIEVIKSYVAGVDFNTFAENQMMLDACIRQLQVIGEACGKVSMELRAKKPEIPWREIIGLRILVVHEYFGLDERIIWDIIKNDLLPLKQQIEAALEEME